MVQEEDVKVMEMMDDWGRILREVVLRDLNRREVHCCT